MPKLTNKCEAKLKAAEQEIHESRVRLIPELLWEKRRYEIAKEVMPRLHIGSGCSAEQIAAGEACLSVRQWSGAPYRSKQVEIARLTCKDGIGLQMLSFAPTYSLTTPFVGRSRLERETLAAHDGLSLKDWENWFYHYDLTKPLAIIHFTKFRY